MSYAGIKNVPLLLEAVRRARGGEQAKTMEARARDGVADALDKDAWGPINPFDR